VGEHQHQDGLRGGFRDGGVGPQGDSASEQPFARVEDLFYRHLGSFGKD